MGIALLPSHPVLHLCCVRSTSRCYIGEGSSITFGVTRCFVGLILLRHTLENRMAEGFVTAVHGGLVAGESISRRNRAEFPCFSGPCQRMKVKI
jgi:hypothetical protein